VLTAADVADLARDLGLADVAADLAALARPSLRLLDEPGLPEPPVGATRLGGLPGLPADVAWPHPPWPGGEREAMTFFGQVALADLDPDVWPGPRTGLLSFFCHQHRDYWGVDEASSARVLHLPDGATLEPRLPPDTLGDERLLDDVAVVVRRDLTIPDSSATAMRPFGFSWGQPRHGDQEVYWALQRRLRDCQGVEDWRAEHRLLGWPRLEQDDFDVSLASMGFEAEGIDYGTEDMVAQAPHWRLLLQVDSSGLGTSFGDGGRLYFGILADDLAAGRFHRVQAISQCG
jgi:Domain of unknown function (DUF1963)